MCECCLIESEQHVGTVACCLFVLSKPDRHPVKCRSANLCLVQDTDLILILCNFLKSEIIVKRQTLDTARLPTGS